MLCRLSKKHVRQVYLHAPPGMAVQSATQDPAWGVQAGLLCD